MWGSYLNTTQNECWGCTARYVIHGLSAKWKCGDPCSKIEHFKTAAAEHSSKYRTLLSMEPWVIAQIPSPWSQPRWHGRITKEHPRVYVRRTPKRQSLGRSFSKRGSGNSALTLSHFWSFLTPVRDTRLDKGWEVWDWGENDRYVVGDWNMYFIWEMFLLKKTGVWHM